MIDLSEKSFPSPEDVRTEYPQDPGMPGIREYTEGECKKVRIVMDS